MCCDSTAAKADCCLYSSGRHSHTQAWELPDASEQGALNDPSAQMTKLASDKRELLMEEEEREVLK